LGPGEGGGNDTEGSQKDGAADDEVEEFEGFG